MIIDNLLSMPQCWWWTDSQSHMCALLQCQESHQNEERHGSLVHSTKLENYYKGLEVASSQLRIGKMIGRGAFGRVYEGYLQYTKDKDIKKVAVKRLKGGCKDHFFLNTILINKGVQGFDKQKCIHIFRIHKKNGFYHDFF